MKKNFTLLALFVAFTLCAKSQISDDFETYEPFTVDPAGIWSYYDGDGLETYAISGVTFDNQEYIGSCIVFNPTVTPLNGVSAHSGNQFLAFFNANGGATDDWVISPELTFSSDGTISFFARSLSNAYGPESMKVWYSTTDNNPSSFTLIASELVSVLEWTEYSYTVPSGAKYVALNCTSNDCVMLLIDDVVISCGQNDIADIGNSDVCVYPIPASSVVNVNATSNISNVEIYSISGLKIRDFFVGGTTAIINTESMSNGIYLIKVKTENGIVTKKFSVIR